MNREIKFRAWDKEKKEMREVTGINWYAGYIRVDRERLEDLPIEDASIMQYVGFKDKNGREIYEGDIIQYKTTYYGNHKTHTTLVEWKDDLEHDGFGEPLAMGYIFHGIENEVIGNIFENPNLLNKENEKTNITSSI